MAFAPGGIDIVSPVQIRLAAPVIVLQADNDIGLTAGSGITGPPPAIELDGAVTQGEGPQGGTGDPLICMMQAAGVGTSVWWNGEAVEADLVPAINQQLGGVMAGAGLSVAADGTASVGLPFLHISMGVNDAAINNTSWLQWDCTHNPANLTAFNVLAFTANADGTLSLPDGHYLITGSLGMETTAFDTYAIPAQITVALGQRVGWPGQSPDAVYANPAVPNSSQTLWPGGTAGVVTFAGILPNVKAVQPVSLAYTYEGGQNSNTPLFPAGDVYVTNIG